MLGQSNSNVIASYIKIENEDITVTQNGVYEASAEYTGLGIVTVQVDNVKNQQKTVNPTKELQTIEADEGYTGLSRVTINPVTNSVDNNIQAGNIKSGVTILGITGDLIEANNTQVTVTPSTSQQTITPSGDYNGFSTVNVNAVNSSIDPNIVPSNIVSGKEILGVQGSAIALNGAVLNVTPTATSQTFIPTVPNNGYIQVNVNGDNNLVSDNIVKDVTIFGVTGNYEGQVINNQDLTINENGTYEAGSGYTGLGQVIVNVTPTLKNETFTQNGVYTVNNSYVALKWWGNSKQGYTGSSTLVGDWIWFNSNNFFSPQVGDHIYNGKDVNGEIIPNFEDVISTIRDKEITSQFSVDFLLNSMQGNWILTAYDYLSIEINNEKYFKVDVRYPKQDSSKPIVGDFIWVRSDTLEEIDEGSLVYNSTDSSDDAPDLTYTLGTVTSTNNMTVLYQFADVNGYGFRYPTTVGETNTYTDGDYDGYGTVTVNVPSDVNNQNISVTVDGTYTPDQGYSGLGEVVVTAGAIAAAEIEAQLHKINSGSPE